jgi:S4 domain protein YaaA
VNIVKISTEFITLGQFLKIENLISSGGQAKLFLSENEVLINDEIDQRRGRKLRTGDHVKVVNQDYQIVSEL